MALPSKAEHVGDLISPGALAQRYEAPESEQEKPKSIEGDDKPGVTQPGPKFDYKLAWLERLTKHAKKLKELQAPVVLVGDYNVVPTEL